MRKMTNYCKGPLLVVHLGTHTQKTGIQICSREFYYSLARRKGAVDSRLLDHLKRYPVFFRESRRQILQFDEQPAFDAFCRQKAAEVNARSVMDGVGS